MRTTTLRGSWLAWTAARTRAGEAPDTPMGSTAVEALPAKAKPRMAAMATGATRQVITAERSRTRRRSSLRVMTAPVRRGAPDPGDVTAPAKTNGSALLGAPGTEAFEAAGPRAGSVRYL